MLEIWNTQTEGITDIFAGRHAIVVTPADQKAKYLTPPSTSTAKETLRGIWRMFSTYPYWDVSYLVAVIFTLGSLVWCINAFFVWLPLQDPSTEFPGEIADAGGITAFIGATIFEIGSVLLMIEAVNENRADCFGWALEEVLEEEGLLRLVYLFFLQFNISQGFEHWDSTCSMSHDMWHFKVHVPDPCHPRCGAFDLFHE